MMNTIAIVEWALKDFDNDPNTNHAGDMINVMVILLVVELTGMDLVKREIPHE